MKYLTEKQVSKMIGKSLDWLRHDRVKCKRTGKGVPFYKIGGHVRYLEDDVKAWLESNAERFGGKE